MKYLLLLLIPFASCAPTYLVSKSEFNAIPKGSRQVIASLKIPADSLFGIVARTLAKDGFPTQSDKFAMNITSTGKSIGNGTFMKPSVFIEPTSTGSRAVFSGQWSLDQSGQIVMQAFTNTSNYGFTQIVFGKTGTTKADVAFQKLFALAEELGTVDITFSK